VSGRPGHGSASRFLPGAAGQHACQARCAEDRWRAAGGREFPDNVAAGRCDNVVRLAMGNAERHSEDGMRPSTLQEVFGRASDNSYIGSGSGFLCGFDEMLSHLLTRSGGL